MTSLGCSVTCLFEEDANPDLVYRILSRSQQEQKESCSRVVDAALCRICAGRADERMPLRYMNLDYGSDHRSKHSQAGQRSKKSKKNSHSRSELCQGRYDLQRWITGGCAFCFHPASGMLELWQAMKHEASPKDEPKEQQPDCPRTLNKLGQLDVKHGRLRL